MTKHCLQWLANRFECKVAELPKEMMIVLALLAGISAFGYIVHSYARSQLPEGFNGWRDFRGFVW